MLIEPAQGNEALAGEIKTMTAANWNDKNGKPIEVGSLVEAKGHRWTVFRFRKNTVCLFRISCGYKTRRVEEYAYPSACEVVG